jgi:hypothetical protein
LVLCHYKYRIFEECHYYSSNCVSAITISQLFERCHYVRETTYRAHLQAYRGLCIFVWTRLPLTFLSLVSLTCGTHTSGLSSTSVHLHDVVGANGQGGGAEQTQQQQLGKERRRRADAGGSPTRRRTSSGRRRASGQGSSISACMGHGWQRGEVEGGAYEVWKVRAATI